MGAYDPKSAGEPVRALLIGQHSFLAEAVLNITSPDLLIDGVSHDAVLSATAFTSYDVVVNMAYTPSYMTASYDESTDFDLAVAKLAAQAGSFFVMVSTRRIYGAEGPFRLSEDCTPDPRDHYGRNKLRTEKAVQALLGDRCTILRVSNVFSFEPGRHTFFGKALRTLKHTNQIVLDVSPYVARDFIYIEDFALLLRRVLIRRPPGVYNLGSGRATELGRIALWVIEGFGSGQLVIASPVERDCFELDISRLISLIGPLDVGMTVRRHCINIGRKLQHG